MSGSEVSGCVLPLFVCVLEIKASELVKDDFREQFWSFFSFVSLTSISVSLGKLDIFREQRWEERWQNWHG